jgi:hypothetical protein
LPSFASEVRRSQTCPQPLIVQLKAILTAFGFIRPPRQSLPRRIAEERLIDQLAEELADEPEPHHPAGTATP